jgi:hypothetical protein
MGPRKNNCYMTKDIGLDFITVYSFYFKQISAEAYWLFNEIQGKIILSPRPWYD